MYLRSIQLKNTGPIQDINLALPFEGENPKPLVLVGRNGSGKSTVISFVVNALIGLKQQVYEDVEVEKGKVYRIRSPLGIHGNEAFYFANLKFEKGVSLIEWQLNRIKQDFSEADGFQAAIRPGTAFQIERQVYMNSPWVSLLRYICWKRS